ncbi:hypothetical protein VSR01_28105 [Actinacidiphila sp. DG2A-62]|uniref:hypothetical protein n=1 Tax=Actinacidiphila sp. DG2A-62 TaxID=3108821 RepID=UPI002DB82093|nr:hypothetical protein [Actinacidiphila sp. DG2A-62]MEC3997156.1 hypothetical protein [Actinacidiphila sp. DG2A-62]
MPEFAAVESEPLRPPLDRLSRFATALADRLHGDWTSSDLSWPDQTERRKVTDFPWDHAATQLVVFAYGLSRGALLTAEDFTQLLVIGRPTRPRQFFAGALTPLGIDITGSEVPLTPHGIAVARHPAKAAYAVASRLLPAYHQARHALLGLHPSPPYRTAQVVTAGAPRPGASAATGARR